jgi:hypothetical protein
MNLYLIKEVKVKLKYHKELEVHNQSYYLLINLKIVLYIYQSQVILLQLENLGIKVHVY